MARASPKTAAGRNERRWIVITADGRFSTLGRASDPSEAEILAAEAALCAQGLSGWLAIMVGNPYIGPLPRIMEVRPLAGPLTAFDDASEACVAAIRERRASVAR